MSARLPGSPASGGLLDALRSMGATLGETARVRGALLGVELREEIERRKDLLVLAAVGAVFLHTALMLLSFLVAVAFWDTHRLGAIGALAAFYIACGGAVFMRLRMKTAASPSAFAATLGELDQDLAQLRAPR